MKTYENPISRGGLKFLSYIFLDRSYQGGPGVPSVLLFLKLLYIMYILVMSIYYVHYRVIVCAVFFYVNQRRNRDDRHGPISMQEHSGAAAAAAAAGALRYDPGGTREEVARRLRGRVRPVDVVGRPPRVIRPLLL